MMLDITKQHGKRILVSGGVGFIGSHFIELLADNFEHSDIYIVDSFDRCVSRKTQDVLQSINLTSTNNISIFEIDMNELSVSPTFDYIVNFAAKSQSDRSINRLDEEFVTTNINGTYSMLRLMNTDTRFVQVGTSEVYKSISEYELPTLENGRLDPSSLYSSTKASADLIALSFHNTHGKDVIVTRCVNTFGPRQYTEKFIPIIINKILNHESIPVYESDGNVNQWIHVKDHCEQLLAAMLYGKSGQVYNIKSRYSIGVGISNLEIVDRILNIMDESTDSIEFVGDRKGHNVRYSIDNTKLMSLFRHHGIDTTLASTFDDDLTNTINWYAKNNDWWD